MATLPIHITADLCVLTSYSVGKPLALPRGLDGESGRVLDREGNFIIISCFVELPRIFYREGSNGQLGTNQLQGLSYSIIQFIGNPYTEITE